MSRDVLVRLSLGIQVILLRRIFTITMECSPLCFKLKSANMTWFNISGQCVLIGLLLCCLEWVLRTCLKFTTYQIKLGQGHLICWYTFPPIVAKWTRPKLKNTTIILFFIGPRLMPYLWNYWSHRNGSPINFCKISQRIQLRCSEKSLVKQLLPENHWRKWERNGMEDSFLFFPDRIWYSKARLKK